VAPLDLSDLRTHGLVEELIEAVAAHVHGPYVHIGADEAFGAVDAAFALSVSRLRAMVRAGGGSRPWRSGIRWLPA
jgi:hexosaminidase